MEQVFLDAFLGKPSSDEMTSSMGEGSSVDVIYLDLSKAYDRISYHTVVSNLGHHSEEGQDDGEGLEHLPQEERLRAWPLFF